MVPRLLRIAVLFGCGMWAGPILAQGQMHEQMHRASEKVDGGLGVVHFATSGAPQAQAQFLRGLLLLHSFEYAAARHAFEAAWKAQPGFAMAIWGEALTYNHALWGEQDTAAARAVLARLGATPEQRQAKAPTPRERAYLASVDQLYGEGDKSQRDARYCAALEAIAHRYPDDLDGRSLYALALLSLSGGKRNVANYMHAAAEAEAVYDVDRHHPGALHYLIHAYDDPVHAPLGLRAARLYSKVAPAASHAQHMPSHIYFALGLWDDAIAANIASLKVSRAEGDGGYHALLWLEYAYLQKNMRSEAAELVRSVAHDVSTGPTRENRLRLAFARATWLAETGGENGPDALTIVDSSDVTFFVYFAVHDFVRGLGAAAHGDLAGARVALAQLRSRYEHAGSGPTAVMAAWYDAASAADFAQAHAMADALDGAIQFDGGHREAGLALVQSAIDATAQLEFEYGPPWSAKPLDELQGELLLTDGQRLAAAAAFQRTLATYPNRRLAQQGLTAATAGPAPASP
jgi:tetratricopeptide (TPR) repeat protein